MSGKLEAKLRQMGYELPPPFTFPKNNRTGCTQAGNVLFLSGHGLIAGHGIDLSKHPKARETGKFGVDITVEVHRAEKIPSEADIVGWDVLASPESLDTLSDWVVNEKIVLKRNPRRAWITTISLACTSSARTVACITSFSNSSKA